MGIAVCRFSLDKQVQSSKVWQYEIWGLGSRKSRICAQNEELQNDNSNIENCELISLKM